MKPININYKGYLITTDKNLLQPNAIHRWLSEESYWSKHIPYSVVKTSFDNSYCIGVLKDDLQIGYARFVTDYATFAYLADVYVEEPHRGQGLSKKMMELLMDLDWVKGLRRIMLATLDAHSLYEQFGFAAPAIPERCMEINRPVIYGDTENVCK
jgi:GNAT superfamily N-acetyltransferase